MKAKCLLCRREMSIPENVVLRRKRFPKVVFICARGTRCRSDFNLLPFLPYEANLVGFYQANRTRHPQVGIQGARRNALGMYWGFLISEGWNPVWEEFKEAIRQASVFLDLLIEKEETPQPP